MLRNVAGHPGKIGHVTGESICTVYGHRLDGPLSEGIGGCLVERGVPVCCPPNLVQSTIARAWSRFRAQREQLKEYLGLSPETQGQNLALTV